MVFSADRGAEARAPCPCQQGTCKLRGARRRERSVTPLTSAFSTHPRQHHHGAFRNELRRSPLRGAGARHGAAGRSPAGTPRAAPGPRARRGAGLGAFRPPDPSPGSARRHNTEAPWRRRRREAAVGPRPPPGGGCASSPGTCGARAAPRCPPAPARRRAAPPGRPPAPSPRSGGCGRRAAGCPLRAAERGRGGLRGGRAARGPREPRWRPGVCRPCPKFGLRAPCVPGGRAARLTAGRAARL